MKDQHSTSDNDKKEPVRPRSIPDDFVYDPVCEGWFAPGQPGALPEGYFDRMNERIKQAREEHGREGGSHLISVDELRAAGALDLPPAWRKSLGGGERDLFSDSNGDDEDPENESPVKVD